ncbi:hypothetical protein GCM10010435_16770 [Winogradskya consettensis]|uniref:Uncharacterized protein n=1 Tax=Winogradskya consettensis TaxID=113560 RepID=A0A919SW84_9ACTN|nr:hypothetical protein [Actinoplanes consettensis]GIM78799.1 hypothetical protein Aco04nite_62280 [Actinoplanes consettensis]
MSFSVQPEALDGYAQQVGRAGDDSTAITGYLSGYPVDAGWDGVLIELIGNTAFDSMQGAIDTSRKVATILDQSRSGLTEAAKYYRETDTASAAKIDASLPGRCASNPTTLEQRWADQVCGPGYADSRDPSGHLAAVGDVEYSHPLALLDNLSVSNWTLKGFDYVFGFNPLDKVSEFFVGEWQSVAQAGKALGHAGEAHDDLAYNVQGGAIALGGAWEGLAADAAYQHFTGLAAGVESLVDPLKKISAEFDTIAQGVYNTSEAVTGWVKGMADAAMIAGIAVAAGTVTAETGVGAVVGYGLATIEVCELLDMWAQATAAMNNLYAIVQGALGVIQTQLAFLQHADLPDLSGYGAYQHPVAGN